MMGAQEKKQTMGVHVVSVQVTDDGGKSATVIGLYVPDTVTIAQLQAWLNIFLPDLDVITAGKITRAGVNLGLTLPGGLKATAVNDRPVNNGANMSFSAAGTSYRSTVWIPAIDQGLVTGQVLQTGDALFTDFKTDLVTGDGTVAPTDKFGNDLTAFLSGDLSFRKR